MIKTCKLCDFSTMSLEEDRDHQRTQHNDQIKQLKGEISNKDVECQDEDSPRVTTFDFFKKRILDAEHETQPEEQEKVELKNNQCYKCLEVFHDKRTLTYHQEKKIIPCDLICRICNEKQKNKTTFSSHMRKIHDYKTKTQKKTEELREKDIPDIKYKQLGKSFIVRMYELEMRFDDPNVENIIYTFGENTVDDKIIDMFKSNCLNYRNSSI